MGTGVFTPFGCGAGPTAGISRREIDRDADVGPVSRHLTAREYTQEGPNEQRAWPSQLVGGCRPSRPHVAVASRLQLLR